MGNKAFSLYTNETEFVDEISANTAVESILRFMVNKGIIKAEINDGCMAEIISKDRLKQIHSPAAGIFKNYVKTGDAFYKGDLLCELLDPLEGNVIKRIEAPYDGIVFFRYNRPLVFEKTVLYKMIRV